MNSENCNTNENRQTSTHQTVTNFPTKLPNGTAKSRQVKRVSAFYRQVGRPRKLADEVMPLANEGLVQGGDRE